MITISPERARDYLTRELQRLVIENGALNDELNAVRVERDALAAERNNLSSIMGDMHRELEELDPDKAAKYALSPNSKKVPALADPVNRLAGA